MYRAFGDSEKVAGEPDFDPVFRWVGQLGYYHDKELGEYNLRARDYEIMIARLLSRDPLGFEAGDTNPYRYVGNNPLNSADPSGLACTGLCFQIKKSNLISCTASNIKTKGCGASTLFITAAKLCEGIKESVEGQKGLKIDTCAGTEQVCGAPVPCSCQNKMDKKGQVIGKNYKGLTIELVEEVKKGCFATCDLKVQIKVGEGWEGTCRAPKPKP